MECGTSIKIIITNKITFYIIIVNLFSGIDSTNSFVDGKHLNETNLLRSDNFEELLEDIEAEAEICSPTKPVLSGDIKQKKKSLLLGVWHYL